MKNTKKDDVVRSKKWHCKKCGSSFENTLPCTAVLCKKCTVASSGVQKWMSPST